MVRVSGSSSYRGQNCSECMTEAGEIYFGSNQRKVRVSEGSSYRESTVVYENIVSRQASFRVKKYLESRLLMLKNIQE